MTDLAEQLPRPLDRGSPLPLWAQLEGELRRRLAAGAFTERFPTDRELVEAYDVSRNTVREAVDRLCAEGLLERRRGLGTFVRAAEFEQPTGALYSLFRSIEAQGVPQTSRVLQLEQCGDAVAARRLDLAPDAPLVLLSRLRCAGDEPLALDRVWLPADIARPLLDADFSRTALYDELAARCGVVMVEGWERIRPVMPTAAEREVLAQPEGEAVFAIERLGRSAHRAVEWRVSLVRGDRYAFVADWRASASGAAPRGLIAARAEPVGADRVAAASAP
jgi:GntR family transcriptional regulator